MYIKIKLSVIKLALVLIYILTGISCQDTINESILMPFIRNNSTNFIVENKLARKGNSYENPDLVLDIKNVSSIGIGNISRIPPPSFICNGLLELWSDIRSFKSEKQSPLKDQVSTLAMNIKIHFNEIVSKTKQKISDISMIHKFASPYIRNYTNEEQLGNLVILKAIYMPVIQEYSDIKEVQYGSHTNLVRVYNKNVNQTEKESELTLPIHNQAIHRGKPNMQYKHHVHQIETSSILGYKINSNKPAQKGAPKTMPPTGDMGSSMLDKGHMISRKSNSNKPLHKMTPRTIPSTEDIGHSIENKGHTISKKINSNKPLHKRKPRNMPSTGNMGHSISKKKGLPRSKGGVMYLPIQGASSKSCPSYADTVADSITQMAFISLVVTVFKTVVNVVNNIGNNNDNNNDNSNSNINNNNQNVASNNNNGNQVDIILIPPPPGKRSLLCVDNDTISCDVDSMNITQQNSTNDTEYVNHQLRGLNLEKVKLINNTNNDQNEDINFNSKNLRLERDITDGILKIDKNNININQFDCYSRKMYANKALKTMNMLKSILLV